MRYFRKLLTALHLARRLDWDTLRRRWFIFRGQRRLSRLGDAPFVHREMGFPAVCHPDWSESRDQFCSLIGFRNSAGDAWEFSAVRAWLRPGDAVIDAGANLGLYTFAAAERVGPGGEVLAVDADQEILRKLETAIALLAAGQIQPLHAALSDHTGTLTFYLRKDRRTTADQSLVPDPSWADACTAVEVPAYTLRDLIDRLARPQALACVKIDIEGAEALALGTVPPEFLTQTGPLWLLEIFPRVLARFGATPADVIRYFPPQHFDLWLMPKHPFDGSARRIRRFAPADPLTDSLYYNLLAIPLGAGWADRRRAFEALCEVGIP